MALTQINGGTQVKANTVTSGQVDSSVIVAGGGNAFTGNQSMGSHKLTSVTDPTSAQDAATKAYVDAVAQGLANKYSADAATNNETLTIASGSVTQIAGTIVDTSVSPAIGEFILIPNAPASTGAAGGSTFSTQPANGLYIVTGNTTNLTVSRAADMSGANGPFGSYVFVAGGAVWGGGGYVVTTPSTPAAFTYGTGNIKWTQFSGAGEITVDSTITKTGNALSRAALTGDVTAGGGSNATTIAAAAVTLAKQANLAANSVIGNSTGSSATPTAVPLASAATASAVAFRDANADIKANAFLENFTSVTAAAGTTTLTVASSPFIQVTGSTTQTIKMPDATTLVPSQKYTVYNNTAFNVTVNDGNSGLLFTVPGLTFANFICVNVGSVAGAWLFDFQLPGPAVAAPATGMVKSNGTFLATAVAGTDYMAPADFVTRETPSGTVNGSNVTFTLANTPLSGTEELYLNGILQEPGSGNDYTISGATITYLTAPLTGDKVRCSYRK